MNNSLKKTAHREHANGLPDAMKSTVKKMMSVMRIGFAGAYALVMTACNGHIDPKKPDGHHLEQKHEDHKVRLPKNVAFAEQMNELGAQESLDRLQKVDPILVPEDSVEDVIICCIDERQIAGKNYNVAGVGVLLSDEKLEVIARNAVDLAKRKHAKGPVTIRVRPHLEGQCGAAALSRKNRKEQDMSPPAIDAEAMKGAERTAERIRQRARDMGVAVRVVVEPYDPRDFFHEPNHGHPAPGVMVNGTSMVTNHDRKEGSLFFNVNAKLAGDEIAEDDAILAGVIALLSKHGMHESAQKFKLGTPFRIILARDNREDANRLKAKMEQALKSHEKLSMAFLHGRIAVDTWVPQMSRGQKKRE